jgi:hypothetical protein
MVDYPGMDTDEFGKILFNEHMYYGEYSTFTGVDSVGPGVGCFHYLRKTKISNRIYPCKYKEKWYDAKFDRQKTKIHFDCWRSQAWWKFKEDIEDGDVDLRLLANHYPNFNLLQEEIFVHTYQVKNGILRVRPKDEIRKAKVLGRSPDRADALIIWNWMRHFPAWREKKDPSKSKDYGYETAHKEKTKGTEHAYT